jgi:WD40 repeat protein
MLPSKTVLMFLRNAIEGARDGFSCLAWSQDGRQLAAGGQDGELIVWSESKRGKGFG